MMQQDKLEEIKREVTAKFPYLSETHPQIKTLPDGTTMLTFEAEVITESKFKLPIKVKVKAAPSGDIISISTSK